MPTLTTLPDLDTLLQNITKEKERPCPRLAGHPLQRQPQQL